MSAMVAELYAALRKAGVEEQLATKADVLAVKADSLMVRTELKADMAASADGRVRNFVCEARLTVSVCSLS